MSPTLRVLLADIVLLPVVDRLSVFGSVARGASNPLDLDVLLDARDCVDFGQATVRYRDTLQRLLSLSRTYYGYLDPFIWTQAGLTVRNDTASGWIPARNEAALVHAILEQARPLLDNEFVKNQQ